MGLPRKIAPCALAALCGLAVSLIPTCATKDYFQQLELSEVAVYVNAAPGIPARGVLSIRNYATKADDLLAAQSDSFKKISFREQYREGFDIKTRTLPAVHLPAGVVTALRQEAVFLFLEQPSKPPRPGDTVRLRLQFRLSGPKTVLAPVKLSLDSD